MIYFVIGLLIVIAFFLAVYIGNNKKRWEFMRGKRRKSPWRKK